MCGLAFLILATVKPSTNIEISETAVSRAGNLRKIKLTLDQVAEARIRRDPDAENYKEIVLLSKNGRELRIDARFLNPDSDGIVACLRENLWRHGIQLGGIADR